jgi:hypothetical protein
MAVGSAKYVNGFADTFGGHLFNAIDYSGPTSYVNTGVGTTSGDTISHRMFGFENTIETIIGASVSQSGNFQAVDQVVQNGVGPWRIRWFVIATGAEVANGINLSGETVRLAAIGF